MPTLRSDDQIYILANNASTTGAGVAIRGGEYQFTASGTAGGSVISLQLQMTDGSWMDVSVYSGSVVKTMTLPYSQTGIDLPAGNVRMTATGGTPSGLNSSLIGLR